MKLHATARMRTRRVRETQIVLAPSCKIEVCPKRSRSRIRIRFTLILLAIWAGEQHKTVRACISPLKTNMRSNKPRRMISLRQMRQQPTWNDILTKKHRGWGYVPSSYLHRSERLGRAGKPNPPHVKTCSNDSFSVAAFAGARLL